MANTQQKVAIVTGAVSGIGEELSRGLVANGYRVAGLDLAIQAAAAEVLSKELGDAFNFISCDVSKYAELATAFTTTFDKWGRLDAFCSNAGFVDRSSVYQLSQRGSTE
jgi:NAD(P)-dependent dehydrogenase (short-subunit alcohol dehydrogenase family)